MIRVALAVCLVLIFAFPIGMRIPHAVTPRDECTLALIRPEVTADHRPLLWKNRDVSNREQVVHRGGGIGTYRYVGIGYAGDGSRVYGGINEAGFAVANSNSYNLGDYSGTADDGDIQTRALLNCATLADFRRILHDTDTLRGGRTLTCNFLAFDSTGEMSVFEAASTYFTELSLYRERKYAIRTNYSYSGSSFNTQEMGISRHDRADRLVRKSVLAGNVRIDSIRSVLRDVAPPGWTEDTFPLPYDFMNGGAYNGSIDLTETIARTSTVSSIILQGKPMDRSDVPPIAWFILGSPLASVAVPVWPCQDTISPLLAGYGSSSAPVCARAVNLYDQLKTTDRHVNSRLLRYRTGGILPYLTQEEATIYRYVEPYLMTSVTSGVANNLSSGAADLAFRSLCAYSVSLDAAMADVPVEFNLGYPSPNPFNREVRFSIVISQTTNLTIHVYDAIGRLVDTPIGSRQIAPGTWEWHWKPSGIASGIYFIEAKSLAKRQTKKVLYLK